MADQGKWFKLWCSSLDDQDLENLSIHEWFGWARFGAYVKKHGKAGKIRLREPANAVVNLMRVESFKDVINMIKKFPNYVVEETKKDSQTVTVQDRYTISVKCKNWNKYQGDFSGDRVKKHRKDVTANVTAQEERRREEKRGDENRGDINTLAQAPKVIRKSAPHFLKPTAPEVTAYAKTIGFRLDGEAFCAHYEARGWKYGAGRPMVDWKSAVVTWKKSASPTAMIAPVKEKVVEAPPEELVSQEQVSGLVASLKAKVVPRA